jgi:DeoR family fructose operon transcriptional repressor
MGRSEETVHVMFEEERKRRITEQVQEQGNVTVTELAAVFQVSESTIRRDLRELEEAGKIARTHGGAIALEQEKNEPTFLEKEDRFRTQKEAIALKALSLIEEGDTIFLDSGTTTYYLAKLLKSFVRLTVVTNSPMIVQELNQCPSIQLLVVGGSLRHNTQAIVGPYADRMIRTLHCDKLFLAINGIDRVYGLTTPNVEEAETKRQMVAAARQVILLADHSKYGKITLTKVAELAEIHQFIVDRALPAKAIEELQSEGIRILLAGGEQP